MPLPSLGKKDETDKLPFSPITGTSAWAGIKNDAEAAFLEFVGTTLFLMLAYGGVQAAASEADSNPTASLVARNTSISMSFGISLLVSVWMFYRVTGGAFNPQVSLGLFIVGAIGPIRFVLYCIAQLAGGIAAAAIVLALTPGPLASNTFPAPGVNKAQALFIEMFTTSALVLAVLTLAVEKHRATPFAPVGIGLTVFVCHLWSVNFTGAGMNTARSFGPAVVTGFPHNTHWIYWLGPFMGALLSSALFRMLHLIKYRKLNPGQDSVGTDVFQLAKEAVSVTPSGTTTTCTSGSGNYGSVRTRVADTENPV